MPEYTPELRAEVDAAMAAATEPMWYVWRSGDVTIRYNNDEGDIFEIAADLSDYDAAAIVALHNAYPLLTATIDAQAERIAELEAENARLREALDLLERQCAVVSNSRSATDNIRSMLSQGLMRARAALKDTAQ